MRILFISNFTINEKEQNIFHVLFTNSSMIHNEKTKEISNQLWTQFSVEIQIYQTDLSRECVSLHIQTIQNALKTLLCHVFATQFLDIILLILFLLL